MMAFRFIDLWRWDGKTSRKTYALVGLIGFAIKHNLDRFIATQFFHSSTGQGFYGYWFNYWAPLGKAARLDHLSDLELKFLATILLAAMAFIWVGVVLTVRRLRDAGLPVWLVIFFFAPFLNLLFFAALCALPPREREVSQEAAPWPGPRPLDSVLPRSKTGSALLSIALTSAIGIFFSYTGTVFGGGYGWSLFVGLPFCMGLFAVLLHSYRAPCSFDTSMALSVIPVCIVGFALLALAVEGIICLLMAAPLCLLLSLMGGLLGYFIQARHWRTHSPAVLSMLLLILPASFSMEHAARLQPPMFVVHTAIDVQAPPEAVWQQVVSFSQIAPPTELLFRSGIAYPIRAEITGRGPGAVRRCIFSTGAFVEPIEIWDEPRLLKFGVTATPAPLNELTPYGHVKARHLHGYFLSRQGQFLLTPLPNGGTRLEGTTWYQDAIWPAPYWRLWSDYIIHRIHLRVLNHIRETLEVHAPRALEGDRGQQAHQHDERPS
jgi:uncharacterized membrane protein YhaH (DUF805 family)